MLKSPKERGPAVRVPPPLLFIVPLLTGFIVQHFVPIRIVTGPRAAPTFAVLGCAEILIAVGLAGWAVATFKRLRTPIIPVHPATTLAEEGPYKLTRNPMYLAFTLLYLGIAFVADAFWPVIFLPVSVVLVYGFAIRNEERHLRLQFGEAYDAYCKRVRRWV
jgi:protein-S-isoprenylcysteine O-methyltransferase Ste14